MLRARETDDPSQAGVAQAVAPQTAMDFEAIEKVILPVGIRCCDNRTASIQGIDISRIVVIGRHDAMASHTDRKPDLRIRCGST